MSTESLSTRTPISRRVGAVFRRYEPALVWLALMLYLTLASLALSMWFPGAFADPAQAAFFTWPAIAILTAVGLVGCWLSDRAGFPRPWTGLTSSRWAALLPILGGLAFGAALVALDQATGFMDAVAARRGVEQPHTGVVPMFLIFSSAAVIVEPIYRLLPLGLLQWLLAELALKGRSRGTIFWVLAVLTALLEPLGQLVDVLASPGPLALTRVAHAVGFSLFQAHLLWRYGFLASIVARATFYLIWHVLYIP